MSDPGELRHTLTVDDVGRALSDAGVPRSRRQIIRYCQTGLLDAVKVPGPTGDQWYVAPVSLPKAIGDLKQWGAQRERRSSPHSVVSDHDQPTAGSVTLEQPLNTNPDMARHGVPEPAASTAENNGAISATQQDAARHGETESVMSRYVAQLEKRIEEKDDVIGLLKGQLVAKDDQISELSTRYRETHSLLGAMRRMFAPLLGQSDPFITPDKRKSEPMP